MNAMRTVALLALLVLGIAPRAEAIDDLVAALPKASFSEKAELADAIAASNDPRAGVVLEALVESTLFTVKKSGQLVVGTKDGRRYAIVGVLDGADLGTVKKRALKKVKTNNRLRKHVRVALAGLALSDPDPERRLAAAQALVAGQSESSVEVLRRALERETVPAVRDAMSLGVATIDIAAGDRDTRLAAIATLSDSLRTEVLAVLRDVADDEAEPDEEVRAAVAAVAAIEAHLLTMSRIQDVWYGLSLGSVLLLAAIGLAITFGVMGVINMAHGEMVMLGAYTDLRGAGGFSCVLRARPAFDWSLVVAGACGLRWLRPLVGVCD